MGVNAVFHLILPEAPDNRTLKRWSFEMGSSFGSTWFSRASNGLFIAPLEGWQLEGVDTKEFPIVFEVCTNQRLYSEEYPRGSFAFQSTLAAWLEARIPSARIFYRGDCNDGIGSLYDKKRREELFAYFVANGRREYEQREQPNSPICKYCEEKMSCLGGGPGTSLFGCVGCGHEEKTDKP